MKILTVLQSMIVVLTIALFNIFILLCLYKIFPQLVTTNSDQTTIHSEIMAFLLGENDSGIKSYLNESEYSHIADVKNIIKYLPLVLALLILSLSLSRNYLTQTLVKNIRKIIVLVLIFCLAATLFFTVFFDKFHKLLFPQGNWSFPPSSLLIHLYPEAFWRNNLLVICTLIILQLVLLKTVLTRLK